METNNALATNNESLRDQIGKPKFSFIDQLRIITGTSEISKDPNLTVKQGHWVIGKSTLVNSDTIRCVVLPWRWRAVRLKDGETDLETYNLTPSSKFSIPDNDWILPDGMTPNYKAIRDQHVKNNGLKLRNLAGFEFLFYLPDFNQYAIYFLAATAAYMPKPLIQDVCWANLGATVVLKTYLHPGKDYSWWLPSISVEPNRIEGFKPDEELVMKFLDPGLIDNINEQLPNNSRVR